MRKPDYYPEPLFYSVPHLPRPTIVLTEKLITQIYDAAYKGLRGEDLAYSLGLTPEQFHLLLTASDMAALTVRYAQAANKLNIGHILNKKAEEGDVKAALAIMTHLHGWMPAKPAEDSSNEIKLTLINANPEPATTEAPPTNNTISLVDFTETLNAAPKGDS